MLGWTNDDILMLEPSASVKEDWGVGWMLGALEVVSEAVPLVC